MGIRNFPVISLGFNGGTLVSPAGATPGVEPIPTMMSGVAPKYVAITVTGGAAAAFVVVTPSTGANGAIATGYPIITGSKPLILNVHGYSDIGYEASAASMTLRIHPLEDF
jgi:hypothetical protein